METEGLDGARSVLARMRRSSSVGRFHEATVTGCAASGLIGPHLEAAEIATELSWIAFQTGAGPIGIDHADRAIDLWRERGDRAGEARARSIRALLELEAGRGEAAAEQALDALHLAETSGNGVALSWALNMVGVVFWYCRQHARAAEHCAEAVALARAVDEPLLAGLCLVNLAGVQQAAAAAHGEAGDVRSAEGCFEAAKSASREAIVLLEREGELAQRIVCLLNLATAHLSRREIGDAEALLAAVDALPPVDGDRVRLFRDEVAVELLLATGRHAAALPLIRRGLQTAEQLNQFEAVLNAVRQLAEAHEHLGDFAGALGCFKRRHAMESRFAAERIQQRARMAEIVLGLRRLEAEVADATREREAIARTLNALSRKARDLAEDTRRDALTGISNRRHFDETVAALAPDAAFVFAMIDVDHFKSINDRFSHAVGDTVLRRVAETLRACSRAGDFVARLGGEEFAVVMFDADLALGRRICRRLRLAIRALEWDASLPPFLVTASFGVAGSAETRDPGALLALADWRLYRAKRGGRDRAVSRGGEQRSHSGRFGTPKPPLDGTVGADRLAWPPARSADPSRAEPVVAVPA